LLLPHKMALEQPKKPVGGAYGSFLAEKRPEFTKQCAGQKASAISTLAGTSWKALTDAQKAPYEKKYLAAKEKFDKDMAAFLAGGGEKVKGAAALRNEKRKAKEDPGAAGKKAKKDDPNRPKRPAGGAFGCFLAKNRDAFQKACPGPASGVSKLAGAKWKALTENDKKPYEAEYQIKKAAYEKAMKNYTPPAGADAEEDEEDPEEA